MSVRTAVLGPGEVNPVVNYTLRKGSHARDPLNDTQFRQLERIYKNRNPMPSYDSLIDANFTDVQLQSKFPNIHIYYKPLKEVLSLLCNEDHFILSSLLNSSLDLRIIQHKEIPGMIFIPNPFTWQAQRRILKCIFSEGINPPSLSNLDPFYEIPSLGLWPYLKEDFTNAISNPTGNYIIYEKNRSQNTNNSNKDPLSEVSIDLYSQENIGLPSQPFILQPSNLSALQIIKKMRWVTLGYQYDWTSKEYIWEAAQIRFPELIYTLSKSICAMLGWSDYNPEAGIINYYQLKDTLTGHVDRSEKNDQAPLLSISFGLDAVFLLGGATRQDNVVPFRLRSGDIFIMSGPCRRYYHGVPRIIEDSFPTELVTSRSDDDNLYMNELDESLIHHLMKESRINLNIRQVW